MKILIVTDIWLGFKDILFEGCENPKGMPAFVNTMRQLIVQGNDIDFFLIYDFEPLPEYNIKVAWLKKEQIIGSLSWNCKSNLEKPFKIIELQKRIDKLLSNKKYDFIYAHGVHGSMLSKLAKKYGIPFGQRLYGSFLNDCINRRGKLYCKLRYYTEYKAFQNKKAFLLVTNDGSCGDKANQTINGDKAAFDFYFWTNGVDKVKEVPEQQLYDCKREFNIDETPFLFYAARVSRWKRQDRAIDILYKLKQKGYVFNLYIAGQLQEEDYYQELVTQAKELGVEKQVIFLGAISKTHINAMYKMATACFSLYDVCNLGNVFHEMMAIGAVVVATDDGVVNKFLTDNESGFLIEDNDDAVNDIIRVCNDKALSDTIRKNAVISSDNNVKSWNERINQEIALIEKYVKENK